MAEQITIEVPREQVAALKKAFVAAVQEAVTTLADQLLENSAFKDFDADDYEISAMQVKYFSRSGEVVTIDCLDGSAVKSDAEPAPIGISSETAITLLSILRAGAQNRLATDCEASPITGETLVEMLSHLANFHPDEDKGRWALDILQAIQNRTELPPEVKAVEPIWETLQSDLSA